MQAQTTQPLGSFGDQIAAFLPSFAAGLLVLAIGLALGWVAKRAIVRLLVWLRLDRLAGRVGWRAAFGKGDVRAALYDGVGNVVFGVIVLLFLNEALQRWGLTELSRLTEAIVFYLPNLGLVALIVAVGMAVSNTLAGRVEEALAEEEVAQARLLARSLKAGLLAVVVALALWQLQFAREIVLAGFVIAFGSAGVAFALAVGLGSAKAIERGWAALLERRRKPEDGRA
jgi:Mechanosensitive ion channel, conserved TM helix